MDRTVIVTGGAGGMGLATARIMGRDHQVVLTDVREDPLASAVADLESSGIRARYVVADITDRGSVDALFATSAASAPVRAVVHAAGVSPQMGSAEKIIKINAVGTINITEASLAAAGEGFALVNVASIAGHMLPSVMVPRRTYRLATRDVEEFTRKMIANASRGPARMHPGSAYSLSKNFVIRHSADRAGAFGARGARILSVSPGSFDTEMGRLEEKSGSARLLEFAALKRFGRPDEIAELLAFCAGDKPSYLTGTDILCDGGTKAGLGIRGMLAMTRGA
ncbi:SDR family oxidoreductase [Gordonia amicalis]|uniref:SDR family oxidoreductase n=1 Tax=Gordonia amicalis TaxID=89053 RepID=A0ABU4DCA9_9ACTN|nr:SDR family oxidoreductase [Gordonia amicalis]MDV6307355.1 SDR family oxidoreductase [Gordonia amicalis]MDV7101280.1 SDR family oxidoreductase [Gordonia amicalis]